MCQEMAEKKRGWMVTACDAASGTVQEGERQAVTAVSSFPRKDGSDCEVFLQVVCFPVEATGAINLA